MVLLAELLLLVGILYGGYRLATRPEGRMSVVEPDRRPATGDEGPLTADALVAMHIPMGFGYRKVDVDRLLDRVAQQLPRATLESNGDPEFGVPGTGPFAGSVSRGAAAGRSGAEGPLGFEPATAGTVAAETPAGESSVGESQVSLDKADDRA